MNRRADLAAPAPRPRSYPNRGGREVPVDGDERSRLRCGLHGDECGMATAELAVAMPAVVLVLLLVLATISAGVTQLRVTDAARVAARQAAIGSSDVSGAAQRAGGPVTVSVETGDLTCVTASRRVPGPLGGLGLTARSRACAYTEPTSPEAGAP